MAEINGGLNAVDKQGRNWVRWINMEEIGDRKGHGPHGRANLYYFQCLLLPFELFDCHSHVDDLCERKGCKSSLFFNDCFFQIE